MATDMLQDRFAVFNVDPALAEMVEAAPPDQVLEGILRLEDPSSPPPGFLVVSKFHRIFTGRFRAADTWNIRRHPNVISLKAARPLGLHEDEGGWFAAPWQPEDKPGGRSPQFTGRGCIVAALDFGLDFAHPNFLKHDGTTRVIAFWHQGVDYDLGRPNKFGYGRVFTRDEINAALRTPDPYKSLGTHPGRSDSGLGTHGTHTLDIAAGNGRARGSKPSAAPDADIIFVHLSTPSLGDAGDLGDSVRLLEALDFVNLTADGRPWVANLSVGRTAGSHDGTSLVEQGMHELLRLGPSRAIVQSAGNYRSAHLAADGWLRDGEHRDLDWHIDPADPTGNEIDAWYSGKDRFAVAIRAPGEREFTQVRLGEVSDLEYRGAKIGRIYHRKDDPNNHDNHVEVFLYKGAPPGTWTVRLIGDYVISGRFHAWIERDLAKPGAQSRFAANITSTRYTLGTIATSPLPITVGAYDAAADDRRVAHFSSLGPTRDERHDKPELLAPGVKVVAARSIPRNATRQQGLLIARSGTSMAAPHVTGVVAAMLEAAGRPVSIDVIRECLRRSALPAGPDGHSSDCAWGRLDAAGAIRSIQKMNFDTQDDFLDTAERALDGDRGDRRQSELRFLAGLLRGVDASVFAQGLSPSALYRAFVHRSPMMNSVRGLLDVLGLPSHRPDDSPRPGDLIVRVAPGTGDVGHVAVLASADLMTESRLVDEGIAAESTRPGSYGLVIEAGARPHRRSRPFARRLLDGRGLVAPHTLLLRPRSRQSETGRQWSPDDPELETREPEPDTEAAPIVPVTYGVGSLVPVRRFVDMPLTYEDMITNTTGSAIIIKRTRCDTLAHVVARGEFMRIGTTGAGHIAAITHADLIRSMSAAPDPKLWSLGPGDTLRAALDLVIYHPADPGDLTHLPAGNTRFPLAVIVHGNHGVCTTTLPGPLDPPVPAIGGGPGIRFGHLATFGAEVPSHMGYSGVAPPVPPLPADPLWLNPSGTNTGPGTVAYLQEELARHGIISVSVSTNPANYFNLLVETRADLVLKAVAEMGLLDTDRTSIFYNRIKPRKVALIGHSRGGDAVARAARKRPSIGVQALVQIASTDITGLLAGPAPAAATRVDYVTSPTRLASDVAAFHLVVYGSRDGDVSGLEDVRVSEFGDPFRHYDRSSSQRAFFFWHGATHARFNRFWEDGDESTFDLSDYAHPADLLSRVDQEARTRELVGGCLRFALNGEMAERDRLNGRVLSTIAPARPMAAMWKLGRDLKTIDEFDDLRTDRNALGGRNRLPASGLIDEIRLANENPPGAGVTAFQFMHLDRILRAAFTSTPVPGVGRPPGGTPLAPGSLAPTPPTPTSSGRWRADIPASDRNFSAFTLLTLRVTKKWDPAAITAANAPVVNVRLTDSAGHAHEEHAAGRVSTLPSVRRVTLVRPPASKYPTASPFPPTGWPATLDLTKFHFETWEVDLALFGAAGVNLNQVAAVELEMVGLAGQPVYVDTVSLVRL